MHPVCFDLETYLIEPGAVFPRIVIGAIKAPTLGIQPTVLARRDMLDLLEELLSRDDVRFINQRIAFDFGCAAAARPNLLPLIFRAYSGDRVGCTKLLTQLADIGMYGSTQGGVVELDAPGRRHRVDSPFILDGRTVVRLPPTYSLQNQARRWCGIELVKDDTRTTYADWDGVPIDELPERQREYVLSDLCALDVWDTVHEVCRGSVPLDNIYALARRDFGLALIEARGRYADPVAVDALRREWEHRLEGARRRLLALGYVEERLGAVPIAHQLTGYSRPRAAKRRLYRRLGVSGDAEFRRAVRERIEEGTVSPRRAGQALAYLRSSRWQDVDPGTRRRLCALGLWRPKTRTIKGDRPGTGEFVLRQAPCQEYAEELDKRLSVKLKRTERGAIQMTPENVDLADGDSTLSDIVTYARANSITSYVDRLSQGCDAPAHVRVDGLADSGRTKSGGGMAGLNDQNHRREYGFREVWIPRQGHVFASIDYSQIELCALAQIQYEWFGRSALGDAINAGRDVHLVFAAMLMNCDYETALSSRERGDKKTKEYRNLAKAFNFGRPGGLAELKFREWAKVAYGVDIVPSEWRIDPAPGFVAIPSRHLPRSVFVAAVPEDIAAEARADEGSDHHGPAVFAAAGVDRIRMSWLARRSPTGTIYCRERTYGHLSAMHAEAFPELPDYLARCRELVELDAGRITQLRTGRQRANCRFTQGANSFFQGLVADGATEALYRVWRECLTRRDSPLFGAGVVWFVHDEIGIECREEVLHEAAHRASDIMVETMREYIPDVRIEAAPAAMRRWTKAADDPRLDARGRLMCEEDWRIMHGRLTGQERGDIPEFFRRWGLGVTRKNRRRRCID